MRNILMTVISDLILSERSTFCIRMPKKTKLKGSMKGKFFLCIDVYMNSFIHWIHLCYVLYTCDPFFTWIQCLYEFIMSIWIYFCIEFIYVLLRMHVIIFYMNSMLIWIHLTTSIFTELIHPLNSFRCWHHGSQYAKKRMKAEQIRNKSYKLLLIQLLVKLYQITLLH